VTSLKQRSQIFTANITILVHATDARMLMMLIILMPPHSSRTGFQRMAHPAPRVPGSSSACRLARAMSWRPLWDQNLPSNMRAAAHTSASESVPPEGSSLLASDTLKAIVTAVEQQAQKLTAFSGRFMPMVILFFLMAFVNTILDSLKDTLVITAVGGGAQVRRKDRLMPRGVDPLSSPPLVRPSCMTDAPRR